ncbi:hypothetical protein TNCV_1898011 [Trichonephila clavipes]|uniref:Uncharacterized protein n=1 Tax=Trichonephila clavipes TaxID=2585209 RepID=A0A8X7BK81_TRICX|nr:hypothetical protein TNCV_1898011 [Trichonephila clavipes]
MAINGALDNYHSRTIESSSDILLFSDSRSALQADNLAKEVRNSPELSNSLTLTDADALARRKLPYHPIKYFISELECNRLFSTTISGLRTRYFTRMKISPDGQRSYGTYPHCPDIQVSPNHVFNCPYILAKLHNIDLNPTNHQLLYSPKVFDIVRDVLEAFSAI